MAYEQFKKVTELTQATLALDAVLSPQAQQGELPTAGALRALIALDDKFKGKREILHNTALTFQPLRELLSQYVDLNTGNPLSGAQGPQGGIVLRDKFGCFGRGCGEQQGCFASCSLGPSHMANGEPLGPVGKAPVRWPNGQVMHANEVTGVLKKLDGGIATMPDGKPRHRDNACVFLSLACKVFSIPPAPSGELADKLYPMMYDVLNYVMERAVLPAAPAPAPAAPMMAPMPAVAPPPPTMGNYAPPPVAPPPSAPQMNTQAPSVALPPPPAPAAQATTVQAAAPAGFPKFPAEFDPKARTELCALVLACTRSTIKPMSEKAAQNMIDRHVEGKYSVKKMRSAWVKAAFDRGAATDGTATGKLKRESWPKDIPEIQGYWDESPAPASEPAPTGLAAGGPVLAAPIGASAPVHHFKPEAPATTPQKIDAVETTPENKASVSTVPHRNVVSVSKAVAGMLRTAAQQLMEAAALLMSDTADEPVAVEPESSAPMLAAPVEGSQSEEMAVAKKGKKAPKAKAEKKAPKAKAAKQAKKHPVTAKPHPKYPDVHAEPSAWQPGTRGRPPKGVTRGSGGALKFGKGWREINGKWHAPLKG